ncbi:MAG: histidinol-phosphatase [Robiginitomaculum sp.]|nr:histidinol-phosphatase [Robiginitomaculum sp.]
MEEFYNFAHRLANAAQKPALKYFRQRVEVQNKLGRGEFDPVTLADRQAEQVIRTLIESQYPDHNIRGEEFGEKQTGSEWKWIIDPIDGTRAYISGLPVWGVLIGLYRSGQPVLGIMDQPFTGERFTGSAKGSFLYQHGNRTKVSTRPCSNLEEATISTTDPYLFNNQERIAFEKIREVSRLQRYGLDCYAYSMLAMGGIDLVIESVLQDYDIAALIPIVEAAGGTISNWSGGSPANGGQILASGDSQLHKSALEMLRPMAKDPSNTD